MHRRTDGDAMAGAGTVPRRPTTAQQPETRRPRTQAATARPAAGLPLKMMRGALGLAALVTMQAPFVRAADNQVVQVSAPGGVLGRSETLELAFPAGGRIAEIAVEAGASVRKGQLLARLECDDRSAALAGDEARLRDAQSQLARTRNGARAEERRLSAQQLQMARAELAAAQHRLARIRELRRNSRGMCASEAEHEAAQDQVTIASARVDADLAAHALVTAAPRAEDLQSSTQHVAQQRQSAATRRAELQHCELRAPMDGVVLKLLADDGETVSALDP